MRIRTFFHLCIVCFICSLPTATKAEQARPAQDVPKWNIGDTWQFRSEKDLDRTVTQDGGLVQISMRLGKVENAMTYTVTDVADADGEQCYILKVTGTQKISGSYSTMHLQGEAASGSLTQQSSIEGRECRRTSDLAFVRAELKSRGTIQLSGALGGAPTSFESHAITVARPPTAVLKFPLVEGGKWRVSSTLNTSSSGTTSDSIVTTFNYECEVVGRETVTLKNGDSYECIAIAQKGTQTTQSQVSGLSIDNIDGTFFFAPAIGNRVKDEAEGEELSLFVAGGSAKD